MLCSSDLQRPSPFERGAHINLDYYCGLRFIALAYVVPFVSLWNLELSPCHGRYEITFALTLRLTTLRLSRVIVLRFLTLPHSCNSLIKVTYPRC